MNKRTKELTLAAILTALSILITYSPIKLVLPFFTLTIGAHVPTLLAMFISPWVTLMTVIGSCIGFFMVFSVPSSIIVVTRAATHLAFALTGYKMLKGDFNILLTVIFTALLHAVTEGVAAYILTPIVLDGEQAALTAGGIAFVGTAVHHLIDCAITSPIAAALGRGKIISLPGCFNTRSGHNA